MCQSIRNMMRFFTKGAISFLLHIFWIFPVNNQRITLLNELSFSYGDSLKYLHQYMISNGFTQQIIFPLKSNADAINNAIVVKPMSVRYFKYILTSKVVITNSGGISYLPLRKKQYIINTWHGGGAYKKVGADAVKNRWYKKETILNSKKINCYVASCQTYIDKVMPSLYFSNSNIIKSGLPRNDVLFNNNKAYFRKKVFSYYGLDESSHLVVYAPTFRGNFNNYGKILSEESTEINFNNVLKALSVRFGGIWNFGIRLHPKLSDIKIDQFGIIAMTHYPDMQELLGATDVLITDYSSSIWDFSQMFKPCFLFVEDFQEYNEERGVYTPIETWPGILCRSNEELEQAILNFDEAEYVKKVEKHHRDMGSYETGAACEQVCKRIAEVCGVRA